MRVVSASRHKITKYQKDRKHRKITNRMDHLNFTFYNRYTCHLHPDFASMTNLVCFIDKVVISIQSMLDTRAMFMSPIFAFVTEDRNTNNSMVAHRTRRFPFYLLRKFFELLKSTSAFFLLIRNPLDSRLFKTS